MARIHRFGLGFGALALASTALMLACGDSSSSSASPATTGGTPDGAATADAADSSTASDAPTADAMDAASPGNTIAGSVEGKPFTSVATALWIGAPDPRADMVVPTVVFLFSKAVTCSEISAAGWDTTITPPFRVIELGMIGAAPATYTVTAARPGSAGDALVAYTGQPVVPDGGDAGATDLKGSAGTVTLSSVVAATKATGSFAVNFGGSDAISGTFDATYCASGKEP